MAEGGSLGGRDLDGDRPGYTARGRGDSPRLANVYWHYVFDLWVRRWRRHAATGDMIVVRYADDLVAGFEHRADAERFLQEWKDRMRSVGVEVHPDKTRLIEFGRHAADQRKRRGESKPETFDFLGFTHLCGTTRKTGRFIVKRQTIRTRLSAKLQALKAELRHRWHVPVPQLGQWLRSVVQGWFNYHAVPGNMDKRLPQSGPSVLGSRPPATKPTSADDLGSVPSSGQPVDSQRPYLAPSSERAL